MSETFKYPDSTEPPTKTLTFEGASGGTGGHRITDGESIVYNQKISHTKGGILMVRNLGDSFRKWQYTVIVLISSETYTDKDDVIEFFSSTYANGAVNTFIWTDYNSIERMVRMTGSLTIKIISGSMCEISVNLELENT